MFQYLQTIFASSLFLFKDEVCEPLSLCLSSSPKVSLYKYNITPLYHIILSVRLSICSSVHNIIKLHIIFFHKFFLPNWTWLNCHISSLSVWSIHSFFSLTFFTTLLPFQQYLLTKIKHPLFLPIDENQRVPDTVSYKRCKGIRRAYHKYITTELFLDTCIEDITPERKEIYSFKKHFCDIYLSKTRKVLLTKGSTKRAFFLPMKTEESYLSFPLFIRAMITND